MPVLWFSQCWSSSRQTHLQPWLRALIQMLGPRSRCCWRTSGAATETWIASCAPHDVDRAAPLLRDGHGARVARLRTRLEGLGCSQPERAEAGPSSEGPAPPTTNPEAKKASSQDLVLLLLLWDESHGAILGVAHVAPVGVISWLG
jgi:hypothetical protein